MQRTTTFLLSLALLITSHFSHAATLTRFDQPTTTNHLAPYAAPHPYTHKTITTPKHTPPYTLHPLKSITTTTLHPIPERLPHTATRCEQQYLGIPIFGYQLIIHQDGEQQTITGERISNLERDLPSTHPQLTKQQAKQLAQSYLMRQFPHEDFSQTKTRLMIMLDPQTHHATLIYDVVLLARNSGGREHIQLNANTGNIIKHWEARRHAHYPAAASASGGTNYTAFGTSDIARPNHYQYSSTQQGDFFFGPLPASTNEAGNNPQTCVLESPEHANQKPIRVFDLGDKDRWEIDRWQDMRPEYGPTRETTVAPLTRDLSQISDIQLPVFRSEIHSNHLKAFQFNCQTGPQDALTTYFMNKAYTTYSPLSDAFYYTSMAREMYRNQFNIEPFPDGLLVFTHVDYFNAEAIPTFNLDNGDAVPDQVIFGNGGIIVLTAIENDSHHKHVHLLGAGAFTSADDVGHELGHIITGHYSDLVYEKQSGGMNEAFSDIAGLMLQAYLAKQYPWATFNLWSGGAMMYLGRPYLRDLAHPSEDGRSIESQNEYNDHLNVHFTSGVYNKAFANLITDYQWPVEKGFTVFLLANTHYWTPQTNFNQGLCYLLTAAKQLHYTKTEQAELKSAFEKQAVTCPH